MRSFTVYVMELTDKGQFLHAKINLSHLVPPLVEKDGVDADALLSMAHYGVVPDSYPRKRCDLVGMELVPPVEEVGVVP